jgi:hypothetical protein
LDLIAVELILFVGSYEFSLRFVRQEKKNAAAASTSLRGTASAGDLA